MSSDSLDLLHDGHIQEQLRNLMESKLLALRKKWDEMGIDKTNLLKRYNTVLSEVDGLFNGMIAEEQETINKLLQMIERHAIEMSALEKELGEKYEEPDENLTLIQLEYEFRSKIDVLKEKKRERMVKVLEFLAEDEEVCMMIEEAPYYISKTHVPTKTQMDGLKEHIKAMKDLKRNRFGRYMELKLAIVQLIDAIEYEPNSSLERTLVCEPDDAFVLSAENLAEVERIHNKLNEKLEDNRRSADHMRERIALLYHKLHLDQREKEELLATLTGHKPSVLKELQLELDQLEELKRQNMEKYIHETRLELEEWWTKCYFSDQQRRQFELMETDDFSDEVLKAHEDEVDRVKKYYEDCEQFGLFKMVNERQNLWQEMIKLEEASKDKDRYKKRGYNSLEEAKQRKRVNTGLPKIEKMIRSAADAYEATHGRPFLVNGVLFTEYMQQQAALHEQEKLSEREMKHRERKAQTMHETIYGVKGTPANKRRADNMGLADSSKRARVEVTSSTASLGRTHHGSARANVTRSSKRLATASNTASHGGTMNHRTRPHPNDSTIAMQPHQVPKVMIDTIDSVDFQFNRNGNEGIFTSTFVAAKNTRTPLSDRNAVKQSTPKTVLKSSLKTPNKSVFKTPSGRVQTPGHKGSSSRLTLRNGKPLPFLL